MVKKNICQYGWKTVEKKEMYLSIQTEIDRRTFFHLSMDIIVQINDICGLKVSVNDLNAFLWNVLPL